MQIQAMQIAGPRLRGTSLTLLGRQDRAKLKRFFLSLTFDERRSYFAGGLSNPAIADFCEFIDWTHTRIIASCTSDRMIGTAVLAYDPADLRKAELSMVCWSGCDRPAVVSDLFDLVMAIAPPRCEVRIFRDCAMPELIRLVRERGVGTFMADEIQIPVHPMQDLAVP